MQYGDILSLINYGWLMLIWDYFTPSLENFSQSGSGAIPLQEYRRDIPPGWRPGDASYPLRAYFDRLRLWYRICNLPDEATRKAATTKQAQDEMPLPRRSHAGLVMPAPIGPDEASGFSRGRNGRSQAAPTGTTSRWMWRVFFGKSGD